MTAPYTWDVFSTLDGYGAHSGDWGGYWGKQGCPVAEGCARSRTQRPRG